MTQLILDTENAYFTLPESVKRYRAWREDLGAELTMISGRMVRELRGRVWRVSYQYGFFRDAEKNALIAACERGRKSPITCFFLPPDGNELISGRFFVTGFTYPTFRWSRLVTEDGEETSVPVWADFSVELREVKPSD